MVNPLQAARINAQQGLAEGAIAEAWESRCGDCPEIWVVTPDALDAHPEDGAGCPNCGSTAVVFLEIEPSPVQNAIHEMFQVHA